MIFHNEKHKYTPIMVDQELTSLGFYLVEREDTETSAYFRIMIVQ